MKLTRALAHRLIELYGYTGPREPGSWVAQNQIDRIIYG